MAQSGVFQVTNSKNNKKYIGISHDVHQEWERMCKDFQYGLGIKSMKRDVEVYGVEAFYYDVLFVSDDQRKLDRKQSEYAYAQDVWDRGYNTKPLLNYRSLSEETIDMYKHQFFEILHRVSDGKYLFSHLVQIVGICKNDLEVLIREITEEEMERAGKRVRLKISAMENKELMVEIKSF